MTSPSDTPVPTPSSQPQRNQQEKGNKEQAAPNSRHPLSPSWEPVHQLLQGDAGVLTHPKVHSVWTGAQRMHSLGSQSLSPKPMGAWPNPAPMSQAEPSGLLPVEPWSPHPDQVSRPLKKLKGMTRAPGIHKNFQGAEWGKEAPQGELDLSWQATGCPTWILLPCIPALAPQREACPTGSTSTIHLTRHMENTPMDPRNKQSLSCPPSRAHVRRAPRPSTYWPELPASFLLPIPRYTRPA